MSTIHKYHFEWQVYWNDNFLGKDLLHMKYETLTSIETNVSE